MKIDMLRYDKTGKEFLSNQKHHWFPKILYKKWKNEETGQVYRCDKDKTLLNPRGGVDRNRHTHIFDKNTPSAWDANYEHLFQNADNNINKVTDWLKQTGLHYDAIQIRPVASSEKMKKDIIEIAVSLYARSPGFHERCSILINPATGKDIIETGQKKGIGLGNAISEFNRMKQVFNENGKILILHAPAEKIVHSCKDGIQFKGNVNFEFIYSDGLWGVRQDNVSMKYHILVPILPTISLLISSFNATGEGRVFGDFISDIFTFRIDNDEVKKLNNIQHKFCNSEIHFRKEGVEKFLELPNDDDYYFIQGLLNNLNEMRWLKVRHFN